MKSTIFIIVVLCVTLSFCSTAPFFNPIKIVDLKTWSVESTGILNKTSIDIPNGIYSIGEKLNLIGNVLKNFNDNETKWIAAKPWIFTYDLSGDDLYNRQNIHLVFDGVDTVAEVKFNDVVLGKTQNMFRQYTFDIKKYVKEGSNKISVSFQPPVEAAFKAFSAKSHEIPPKCPPASFKGDCHMNMLRKMQASFGSTFGPSIPSVGFWKSARIEAFRESTLREVLTRVEDWNATFWRLYIDAYLANNAKNSISGRISLHFDSFPKGVFILSDIVPNVYGEMVWSMFLDFNKSKVETWWPNGYGSHKLYNLTVYYYTSDLVERMPKVKMIAFRKIELIQAPTGNGLTFYVAVNKVPIFAKGSNLAPISIMPEEIDDKKKMGRLIRDALDSNMNMLRVWGAGTYLSDHFYHLADQKGVLIWHDFMFSTSLYPNDQEFLSNTIEEVRYQLKRIYSHPSLAIFSANLDIEQALANNWYAVTNKTMYIEDYKQLFVNTIKKEFDRLVNNTGNFIFSSPTNGKQSEQEDFVSKNPNSELYGDVHYLDYTNFNPLDTSKLTIPRFVSAYGVQSLPCVESILKQSNSTADLSPKNNFLIHRQHQFEDYQEMQKHIELLLDLPGGTDKSYDKNFILYSQIIQAYSLKLQTEHYRSFRSIITGDGRGNTMGALYWNMNDVWIAPTRSGIDYYGRWKMAQYTIKDSFAPVIITGTISGNTLRVYVVSDLGKIKYDVNARIQVYTWTSFKPLHETSVEVTLTPISSQLISTIEVDEHFKSLDCTAETCFFHLMLEQNGDLVAPENYVLPTSLKKTIITKHSMKVTSIAQLPYQNIYEVTITADNIAAFVWLDAHDLDGKFSENGFLMVQPEKTVYFYPDEKYDVGRLERIIDVTHSHDPKY